MKVVLVPKNAKRKCRSTIEKKADNKLLRGQ